LEVAVFQILELQKPPMMQSPTALGVGVTARVTVRAVPLGTVSVVRARVPALGPSGCRRWGRWSWGRRGRPTGLDGGGLLLGLPVGIGRLGGFRGLIPFGLLGTLRLIAIGAHRLIWRISPVATPWGQGAPLSSKRIANFMIPPQKCLDVRASIRLKSIVDGQKI